MAELSAPEAAAASDTAAPVPARRVARTAEVAGIVAWVRTAAAVRTAAEAARTAAAEDMTGAPEERLRKAPVRVAAAPDPLFCPSNPGIGHRPAGLRGRTADKST